MITIGEAMGLFVADEVGPLESVKNFSRSIAGAELNVSVGLSLLQHEVYYATMVGKDPLGKSIRNFIQQEKIQDDLLFESDERMTGLQMKEKVIEGDPFVASFRKGSAASTLDLSYFSDVSLDGFDIIHLTGIFPALSSETRKVSHFLADEGKKSGALITFDPNLRPKLWSSKEEMVSVINDLAQKADVVLPGISEGEILTGSRDPETIADFYLQHSQIVIIKLGEKGAYIKSKDTDGKVIPGFKVEKIVDTVGAGDGFAVGVLSALAEGLSLEEAARRGNAVGAIQLLSPSDNEGLPTREQLEDFMKQ